MKAGRENSGKAAGGKCPICAKPIERDFRPFCSRRCADVDLSRWLNGHYAIPAVEDERTMRPAGMDDADRSD